MADLLKETPTLQVGRRCHGVSRWLRATGRARGSVLGAPVLTHPDGLARGNAVDAFIEHFMGRLLRYIVDAA